MLLLFNIKDCMNQASQLYLHLYCK